MLIAGIIEQDGKGRTTSLVSSILSSTGKKVNIIDSKNLTELDFPRIKSYIRELDKNKTDILILKVDIQDFKKEIYRNLQFDIMICADKADDLKGINVEDYTAVMRSIFTSLDDKGIAIVNADDSEIIQFLQGARYYIVTYGFNPKASMTTSSIGDSVFEDNFMCCLQRTVSTKGGTLVEPQEYMIGVESNGFNAYNVLAAATFAVVNGVDLNALSPADMRFGYIPEQS